LELPAQIISSPDMSGKYNISVVDKLSQRYVLYYDKDFATIWDVDSETQMTIKLPYLSEIAVIFPFFKEQKVGILSYEQKKIDGHLILKYRIIHLDKKQFVEEFDCDIDYYTHHLIEYDNKDCCLLIKADLTFDIRALSNWSLVTCSNKEKLPQNITELWQCFYITKLFYINYGIEKQDSEVQVWNLTESKHITSFSGISPFTGIAVDRSGMLGVFYTIADYTTSTKKIKKKRIIQVQTLNAGKIQSQLIYEGTPHGIKFSPVNPRVILIWSESPKKEAILWQWSTLPNESNKIIAKIQLPLSLAAKIKPKQNPKQDTDSNDLSFVGATFSSDGKKVIFFTNNFLAFIYSAETGKLLKICFIATPNQNNSTKTEKINYDNFGQHAKQFRFDSGKLIIETKNKFDELGRLTNLAHTGNNKTYADYDLNWDDANRITDFDFTYLNGQPKKNESKYRYDKTSQLINAMYNFKPQEIYNYDPNGNRK
jgi:hypothetical protein